MIKQLAITAFAIVVGLGLTVHDAEAKRLGGGKSVGMQRQATPAAPAAAPAQAAKPAAPAASPAAAPTATPPKQGMSRFLGPLAGLAAGLGIAALLSHFGMGEAAANFMLIALLVFAVIFVVRMLMKKREPLPAMQYAGAGPASFTPAQFEATPTGGAADTATVPAAAAGNIPADFDVAGFVRQAKLNFIRLQAANDRGDMEDIRQFTAPELFAEIKMQYQERGAKAQETDVQQLDAEVLEVVTDGANHVASVRFHGQIREDNAAPEAFVEIWHLAKPIDGSRGWTIAGIQQA